MSIESYLDSVSDSRILYTGNGGQLRIDCLLCDDTRHRLYINSENHSWYCHNEGRGGSFVTLIQEIENISYMKALERYKEIKGSAFIPDDIVVELKSQMFKPDIKSLVALRPIPLPTEYNPIDFDSLHPINNRALKYLYKRGITDEQITAHSMGFCDGGEHAGRIIIPVYEAQELRFWVSRAAGKSPIKEKSPSNEPYQISKSQVVFNIYNAATIFSSAVICEGIFDALSFGDMGISLLGKALYEDQLAVILTYQNLFTDGIYLALDNDRDGRKAALIVADELYKHIPVKIVEVPEKYNDPNNVLMRFGRQAVFSLLEDAVEYDFSYKVKKRIFT